MWLRHAREVAGMPFDDRDVPVECKNEKTKTGPRDIAWFGEKVRNSGGRDGLLVTVAGLSGNARTGGHEEIRNQLKKGTRIVVITTADLLCLRDGTGFLERHAELRHQFAASASRGAPACGVRVAARSPRRFGAPASSQGSRRPPAKAMSQGPSGQHKRPPARTLGAPLVLT